VTGEENSINTLDLNIRILFKFKYSDCVFYLVHEKYQKMTKYFGHWICFSSLRERVASYVLKLVGRKDLLSITGAEKRNNYNSDFNCFEQQLRVLIMHVGSWGSLKNSETVV
jgi:hypothetical protein